MSGSTLLRRRGAVDHFQHEAMVYRGTEGFLDGVLPFIEEGVRARQPQLVAVDAEKIDRIQAALGGAEGVRFVDMRAIGGNPARIIPVWRGFVADSSLGSRPFRGIGEPVWPGRNAAEMVECHLHEALLNLAFAHGPTWSLMCPYDASSLDPDVIDEAGRTHPFVVRGGVRRSSRSYPGVDRVADGFDDPFPEPAGPDVKVVPFEGGDLTAIRRFVSEQASLTGLGEDRAGDVVLAANELATNSLRYGGGSGTLRLWTQEGSLICEVLDGGYIGDPLVGRRAPDIHQLGGRGLWLVNQLCDLVQIRSLDRGVVVRVHMRVEDPPA